VRELASIFRTRIELKQIGVRDEAKRLDGIGRCGRQYCSASWLPELRPVNLGVAKDQRLSLNPSQISGACGRLMCCLRYEHEFYVQSRKRFPKEGKLIRTKCGEEKVVANDIFRERVTLRGEDGEVRMLELAELRAETEAAGAPLVGVGTSAPSLPEDEAADEELESIAIEETIHETIVLTTTEYESVINGTPEAPTAEATAEPTTEQKGERRPHRRRGRRGGRRNRPGGRQNDDGGTPPEGESEGESEGEA